MNDENGEDAEMGFEQPEEAVLKKMQTSCSWQLSGSQNQMPTLQKPCKGSSTFS